MNVWISNARRAARVLGPGDRRGSGPHRDRALLPAQLCPPGTCVFRRGEHGCWPPAALGPGASGELAVLLPARRPLPWREPTETRALMGGGSPRCVGDRAGLPMGITLLRPCARSSSPSPRRGCLPGLGPSPRGGGRRGSTTLLRIFLNHGKMHTKFTILTTVKCPA